MEQKNSHKVTKFILEQVEMHPTGIVHVVAREFGISRQRAHAYIAREVKKGTLLKVGKTRNTRYFLSGGKRIAFETKIEDGLNEDVVWSRFVKPMLMQHPENIKQICNYGFTEIFNNAIDHSDGSDIFTDIRIEEKKISILIMDNGVGLFTKIQSALDLKTPREAVLHLSKGKFTTDPAKHSGEGIFFTSRAFDTFSISSADMFYSFSGRDWFLSPERQEDFGRGTQIWMELLLNSQKTLPELFKKFADQEIGFTKTIVAVALSADENDPHISRSQAKRLLFGLEKFKTIILDFKNVHTVGQAFVDEVFRVFRNEHPTIHLKYCDASEEVETMIRRGVIDADELKLVSE